ncbi:GNAT family N-acetyltransferase [Permianibacter sp. IMCC34836]|uniref:GNAT family N-acetyltransferase n=1 Tax=Permianibacter fluminis TaxID=2738515 RepID=UPI001B7D804B|nr:GNAT family N-acetyltransferase [Permianibacter fluminis]NQD37737.1 GNAT family N-acetyltransferase [Permianibacter fluminis]
MPHLRTAQPRDAAALAALAERTFRDTFAAMNTADDMDRHCRQSYGEAIQAAEIADSGKLTLVYEEPCEQPCEEPHEEPSEESGELVAYAQLRWGNMPALKHPPAGLQAHHPGEIQRLYVASAWHGKGLAQQLMQACLDEMAKRGCDLVWLGVWEKNPRAIAFYQKFGFVEVGDHSFALGGDNQRDIIMARPLTAAR